jgi:hypothetical protein
VRRACGVQRKRKRTKIDKPLACTEHFSRPLHGPSHYFFKEAINISTQ